MNYLVLVYEANYYLVIVNEAINYLVLVNKANCGKAEEGEGLQERDKLGKLPRQAVQHPEQVDPQRKII